VYLFLSYIPYFLAGHLISQSVNELSLVKLYSVLVLSVLFTAIVFHHMALTKSLDHGDMFYGYVSFTVVPMSLAVMYLLRRWQKPIFGGINSKLAGLTFGVYLLHPFLLECLTYVGIGRNIHVAIYIPISSVLIFIFSISIIWTMTRVPALRQTI